MTQSEIENDHFDLDHFDHITCVFLTWLTVWYLNDNAKNGSRRRCQHHSCVQFHHRRG